MNYELNNSLEMIVFIHEENGKINKLNQLIDSINKEF